MRSIQLALPLQLALRQSLGLLNKPLLGLRKRLLPQTGNQAVRRLDQDRRQLRMLALGQHLLGNLLAPTANHVRDHLLATTRANTLIDLGKAHRLAGAKQL